MDAEKRSAFTFLPFAIGSRQCIGKNFAMLEAKMIIALLLVRSARMHARARSRAAAGVCPLHTPPLDSRAQQAFRVSLQPGQVVHPRFAITLRMSRDLLVDLQPR
jgi:hypothetical protein